MRVVNIKENNPNCEYAIYLLQTAVADAKAQGEKGLIVIHGYGSHGRGGDIKKSVLQYLRRAKRLGVISNFVKGEQWCDSNEVVINALREFPELVLQQNLTNLNSGVSVVLFG